MEDKNKDLKVKFLEYFTQLPVQKLAAAYIGRSEDTISLWKKDDSDFSDSIESARAQFALNNVKSVKNKEWLLERILKEHFPKDPDTINNLTQNNFLNLDDEQLDKLIRAKLKQVGANDSASGEGKTDIGESA